MRLTRTRLCILCAVLSALAAWLVLAVPRAAAQEKPISFINDVAPILKENCFACHDAKKRSLRTSQAVRAESTAQRMHNRVRDKRMGTWPRSEGGSGGIRVVYAMPARASNANARTVGRVFRLALTARPA